MSIQHSKPSKGTDSQAADSTDSEWLDEVFHVLSSSRRRAVIKTLMQHEHIRKTDLIQEVTEMEYGMEPHEVRGSPERERISSSLTQTHLPKLEGDDIIKRERDKIMTGERMDMFVEYMEKIHNDEAEEPESIRSKVAAIF